MKLTLFQCHQQFLSINLRSSILEVITKQAKQRVKFLLGVIAFLFPCILSFLPPFLDGFHAVQWYVGGGVHNCFSWWGLKSAFQLALLWRPPFNNEIYRNCYYLSRVGMNSWNSLTGPFLLHVEICVLRSWPWYHWRLIKFDVHSTCVI